MVLPIVDMLMTKLKAVVSFGSAVGGELKTIGVEDLEKRWITDMALGSHTVLTMAMVLNRTIKQHPPSLSSFSVA